MLRLFFLGRMGRVGEVQRFCQLFEEYGYARDDEERVAALVRYFGDASQEDAAWAVFLLTDRKFSRCCSSGQLLQWACESAGVPDWLSDQCKEQVGDVAETAALVLPEPDVVQVSALHEILGRDLPALRGLPERVLRERIVGLWRSMGARERLVINKLLSGAFKSGVGRGILMESLFRTTGVGKPLLALRLLRAWEPTEGFWEDLVNADPADGAVARPYAFASRQVWDGGCEVRDVRKLRVGLLWNGLRGQLIRRGGRVFLWTDEESYVEHEFPELVLAAGSLPDGTVMEGVILVCRGREIQGLSRLETYLRAGKQRGVLEAGESVVFYAYDVLEYAGKPMVADVCGERMKVMSEVLDLIPGDVLRTGDCMCCGSIGELDALREEAGRLGASGLFIFGDSQSGERVCWDYRLEPICVKAALLYAQREEGGGLFSSFTLGVRKGKGWVSLAKVNRGLNESEVGELDAYVREHSVGKRGPVSTVKPELVFELEYDSVESSARHRAGVVLREPRIKRWLRDADIGDADDLSVVKSQIRGGDDPVGESVSQLDLGI